jgi:hypothetical protein
MIIQAPADEDIATTKTHGKTCWRVTVDSLNGIGDEEGMLGKSSPRSVKGW